jgi:hypothetical protein
MNYDNTKLNVSAKSSNGKGKLNISFGVKSSGVMVNALSGSYMLGGVTLSAGPKMKLPGNWTNTKSSTLAISTKIAGADVAIGRQDCKNLSVTAKGKAGKMVDYAFDYVQTPENMAVVALVGAKVAGLGIKAGYGMRGTNSIMGASATYKVAGVDFTGAYTMAGTTGGKVANGTVPVALGYATGAMEAGANTIFVKASTKVSKYMVSAQASISSAINAKMVVSRKVNDKATAQWAVCFKETGYSTSLKVSSTF